MALRAVTEAESREIVHIALSAIVNFPVASDHEDFPSQPIVWSDVFTNTATVKGDIHKSVVTAGRSIASNIQEAKLSESRLNNHIDQNDSETAGDFSSFLKRNMSLKIS